VKSAGNPTPISLASPRQNHYPFLQVGILRFPVLITPASQEIKSLKDLLRSSDDKTIALMRLVLGIIFFAHGSQKALGLFGGPGWHGTIHEFGAGLHIPAFFAACAILAEFVGSLLLLAGFLSRIAALGIAIVMVVAILKVQSHNGLLGGPGGEGYEFPLALLALAILIVFKGGGKMSVDRAIVKDDDE
jgi:putative oxidoreductase